MRGICFGTGWFAKTKGHKIYTRKTFHPDHIQFVWRPYIEQFLPSELKRMYFIYISDSEVKPIVNNQIDYVYSKRSHSQPHHNDSGASLMVGAQIAFCNEMDYVFIEQDCLVYGLDKAITWAQGKNFIYGYGEWGLHPGWAETSFLYIKYEFIPEFLKICNESYYHSASQKPKTEVAWHNMFKNVADFWPFGYGRKKNINFNDEVFYIHKLTDAELEKLLEKIE